MTETADGIEATASGSTVSEVETPQKRKVRKMSVEAVKTALEKSESLLREVKGRTRSRPKLTAALVELNRQVLTTLQSANADFAKEIVLDLASLLSAHIAALMAVEKSLGGKRNPARLQLLNAAEAIRSELAKPKNPSFNPLELHHLGESTAREFDKQQPIQISDLKPFEGAGVYAIYYLGDLELYKPIADANRESLGSKAIYIGEAGRQGKRKGVGTDEDESAKDIYERLINHKESIEFAENLDLKDFYCRYLRIEYLFVPLCESSLIETNRPLWNLKVDGFGNKHVGESRQSTQQITKWDLLHPGRPNRAIVERRMYRTFEEVAQLVRVFFEQEAERESKKKAGLPVEELKPEDLAESPEEVD